MERKSSRDSLSEEEKEETSKIIYEHLKKTSLEMKAELGKSELLLRDIYSLQVGDVINLNKNNNRYRFIPADFLHHGRVCFQPFQLKIQLYIIGPAVRLKYKKYDFFSPKKFTRDKLRLLKSVYETYSRVVSSRLNSVLRTGCQGTGCPWRISAP